MNWLQRNTVCISLFASQLESWFAPALISFETIPGRLYILLCIKLRTHLLVLKQCNYCDCKICILFSFKGTIVLLLTCFLENVMFCIKWSVKMALLGEKYYLLCIKRWSCMAADFWRLLWLVCFKIQAANTIKLSSGFSSQSGPAVCHLQFMYSSRKAFYSPLRKRFILLCFNLVKNVIIIEDIFILNMWWGAYPLHAY